MSSDTPFTDDNEHFLRGPTPWDPEGASAVHISVARTLERRLNAAIKERDEAERQAAALRAQIHDLCHDLHLENRATPVTPTEFCNGCEAYQVRLFGCSPIADERNHANSLAAALQAIVDGACHPDIAKRRVMVDLTPIRETLAAHAKRRAGHSAPDGA